MDFFRGSLVTIFCLCFFLAVNSFIFMIEQLSLLQQNVFENKDNTLNTQEVATSIQLAVRKELDNQTKRLNEQTHKLQSNQGNMIMQGLNQMSGSFQAFTTHSNIFVFYLRHCF
jgi:predicted PurR-regulated permease PerM